MNCIQKAWTECRKSGKGTWLRGDYCGYLAVSMAILFLPVFGYWAWSAISLEALAGKAESGEYPSVETRSAKTETMAWRLNPSFDADSIESPLVGFVPAEPSADAHSLLEGTRENLQGLSEAKPAWAWRLAEVWGWTPAEPENEDDLQGEEQLGGSGVRGELSRMEEALQYAFGALFPDADSAEFGGGAQNPFQSALLGGQKDNSGGGAGNSSGSTTPAADQKPASGGEFNGGENGGQGTADSGSNGPSNPSSDDPGRDPQFDFLVLTDTQDDRRVAFRSYREPGGTFVLDNGARMSFFSGVVGLPADALVTRLDQIVLSADYDSDFELEYFLARHLPLGSVLTTFSSSFGYVLTEFEASFLYLNIRNCAVFDFNGDGFQDIAVSFYGSPFVFFYEVVGGELQLAKQVQLPFEPALLANTQDQGVYQYQYLQVFDETLRQSVTFSTRYSGAYSYMKPPSYVGLQTAQLAPSFAQERGLELVIVVYQDRVILLNAGAAPFSVLGSFQTQPKFPTVLVGDLFGSGIPRVITMP